MLGLFTCGFAGLALSYFGVEGVRGWAERHRILDIPNPRSSHSIPTPRGGGLVIMGVTVACGLLYTAVESQISGRTFLAYALGAVVVAAVGWQDDIRSVPNLVRFSVQGLAAVFAIINFGYLQAISIPVLGPVPFGWLGLLFTLLWIVGSVNAFNFMDGIDGIAGGQSVVAGLGWTLLGAISGQPLISVTGLLLATTSFGFLIHNWSPARIFMGDVGSNFLGYAFAVLPIIAGRDDPRLFLVGVLLMWPFIFDTLFTFLRRLRRGENVFAAHCSHLYQRLVIVGHSHRSVSLLYIGLALTGDLLALAWLWGVPGSLVAAISIPPLLCLGLVLYVVGQERKHEPRQSPSGQNERFQVKAMATAQGTELAFEKPSWSGQLSRHLPLGLDLLVLTGAFALAYLLRFDFAIPGEWVRYGLIHLSYVLLIQVTALGLAGVYGFISRYIGMGEVKAFLNAALWSLLPLIMLRLALPGFKQEWKVPLSIIVMDTVLGFGTILGLRVLWRALWELSEHKQKSLPFANGPKKRVLLIGAGAAGALVVKQIKSRGGLGLDIKGFIDDDQAKRRSVIHGFQVLGTTEDLPRLVPQMGLDHVVITIAQARRAEIRRIVKTCERIPVRTRIIPDLSEILCGQVEVSQIRDVQIEDLLGREPVHLGEEQMRRFLTSKVVMVTGAGGSIGSELAQQVARFVPASLLLVERAEFALFSLDRNLRELFPGLTLVPLVADIGDRHRMRTIFASYRPQVIVHAAAHKHVPMVESNPGEGVKNNVLGTHVVGQLAGEFGAEVFVLVSTDKAVRPTSIMGASKRVAELVVQSLNRQFATRYVAVRFGNVIGSAGSVIEIFREQISKGGPLTVTHPDMMRYFMSIPEAAQLVLQAGTMGQGGEIFILDMGEPIRILDLAKHLISLSGLRPFADIDIVFTAPRPGEKLFEELELSEERVSGTRHPKILIGKIASYPEEKVRAALRRLATLSRNGRESELRLFLSELLPESRLESCGLSSQDSSGVELSAPPAA